jgi:hypothetical protein
MAEGGLYAKLHELQFSRELVATSLPPEPPVPTVDAAS